MKTAALVGAALAASLVGQAWSQAKSADQVVAEAYGYSLQIREGRFDLAPASLALVDTALKADPQNPKLLTAYAVAQFQMAAAQSQGNASPAAAFPMIQAGAGAFEKAAAIDPNNAGALAGRGATRALMGSIMGDKASAERGKADLNRAVELAPGESTPRLQRAFFGVNLPKDMRDDAAVETDIKVLIARGSPREKDHLHLLLGDLHAENGKTDLARAEYEAANRAGTTAGDLPKTRLAALAAGKPDAAQTASLRAQLGTNCKMCHAR